VPTTDIEKILNTDAAIIFKPGATMTTTKTDKGYICSAFGYRFTATSQEEAENGLCHILTSAIKARELGRTSEESPNLQLLYSYIQSAEVYS
jgi:hypothetical protein